MKTRTLFVLTIAAGATLIAQAQQPKPEDQLKLRKAAYQLMNYSFGGLAAMAEGKRPYAKDDAISFIGRSWYSSSSRMRRARSAAAGWNGT